MAEVEWNDPDIQFVYKVIAGGIPPPEHLAKDHWEGVAALVIVNYFREKYSK